MAVLYPGTSVSGYNANPPPDDGTTGSNNLITWNTDVKGKIGDPLNTFAGSVDSNITSAFGKTFDGATVVSTSTSYNAAAADQGRLIVATTAAITITTPDAGTVTAPFSFAVNNQSTGTITLAGNATNSQTVDGQTTQVIQSGGGCIVKTDGTNWFTYGLQPAQVSASGAQQAFVTPVNMGLTASVNAGVLTVAMKTVAGNDPSSGSPVLIPFRDTTLTAGDPIWIKVTSATSISTNATGATLGTQNSVPFRFWILAFNNAGTVEMALYHTGAGSSTPSIHGFSEANLYSTVGIGSGATSSATFYTPNGISLTSCAFRIIGFLEYSSGLTTAGTYASVPSILQLFGPGIKKPGDVVQTLFSTSGTQTSTTSATKQLANPQITVTPQSAANIFYVRASGTIVGNTTSGGCLYQLLRNSASNPFGNLATSNTSTAVIASLEGIDTPNTTSNTTYTPGVAGDGTHTAIWGGTISGISTTATLLVQELMA